MRIYSVSQVLIFPLVLILLAVFYLTGINRDYSIYIFVPVFLGVILYVFHGPLDHWYRTKFPLKIDTQIITWLNKFFPAYERMSVETKTLFETRLALYLHARMFQAVGSQIAEGSNVGNRVEVFDVPEDFKAMIAAHGIEMSLGSDDYLIGDMDRIFVYKHPFPTPKFHPLHSVEIDIEDGVIIINTEQLINAIIYPHQYYNVAYHAYAESMIFLKKMINLPSSWESLPQIYNFTQETISGQVGMPIESVSIVHVTLAFQHPDLYQQAAPEQYEIIKRSFNI